jgi:hypothetical protein
VPSSSFGVEGDQRVPRRGADPLARSVEEDDGSDQRPRAADEQEADPAERGEAVPEDGNLLVTAEPIRGEAADDAHECGRALLDPVDHAELERRHAEREHEVDREDRVHHLRGDVREHAHEPEEDHRPADVRGRAAA